MWCWRKPKHTSVKLCFCKTSRLKPLVFVAASLMCQCKVPKLLLQTALHLDQVTTSQCSERMGAEKQKYTSIHMLIFINATCCFMLGNVNGTAQFASVSHCQLFILHLESKTVVCVLKSYCFFFTFSKLPCILTSFYPFPCCLCADSGFHCKFVLCAIKLLLCDPMD